MDIRNNNSNSKWISKRCVDTINNEERRESNSFYDESVHNVGKEGRFNNFNNKSASKWNDASSTRAIKYWDPPLRVAMASRIL